MARVFLSHASEDKPLVRRIAHDLKQAGHSVWLDEWEIRVGQSIPLSIQTGIERSDFLIVVLTHHGVASGWVEKEWQTRIGREIKNRSVEILPVKVDDCVVPSLLSEKKYADFRDYDSGMRELLDALAYHQNAASAVPPARAHATPNGAHPKTVPSANTRVVVLIAIAVAVLASMQFVISRWQTRAQKFPIGPDSPAAKEAVEAIRRAMDEGDRRSRASSNPPLSEITADDIGIEVTGHAWNRGVEVQFALTGVPRQTDVYLSTDGKSYERKSTSGRLLVENLARDEIHIKLTSRSDGTTVGPFVKRGLLKPALQSAFEALMAGNSNDLVKCAPTGCEIDRQVLCASGANVLKLGRTAASDEFTYDLRKCEGPELSYVGACFSTPNEIFPLRPGAKLFAAMEYESGLKIPFEVVVANTAGNYDSNSGNWVELQPLQNEQPLAAAMFGSVYGPFEIFLGAGGCYPSVGQNAKGVLYDIDGRGLVEASRYQGSDIRFTIPEKPSNGKIAIAFDHVSGQRIGPFTYRFDAEKIVRAAAQGREPPRLSCTSTYNYPAKTKRWKCMAPGRASLLSWLDVRGIAYGPKETQLTHKLPVSVTTDDVLSVGANQWPPEEKIARFDVPADWTDLYYRLAFTNNASSAPIRVPLR